MDVSRPKSGASKVGEPKSGNRLLSLTHFHPPQSLHYTAIALDRIMPEKTDPKERKSLGKNRPEGSRHPTSSGPSRNTSRHLRLSRSDSQTTLRNPEISVVSLTDTLVESTEVDMPSSAAWESFQPTANAWAEPPSGSTYHHGYLPFQQGSGPALTGREVEVSCRCSLLMKALTRIPHFCHTPLPPEP